MPKTIYKPTKDEEFGHSTFLPARQVFCIIKFFIQMNFPKMFFLGFLWVCSSCQYFTTEKISSETFYEEEIESINWSDVDTYPAFSECENFTEKVEQKSCFQNVIYTAITSKLSEEKLVTHQDIKDTISIVLEINSTGAMQIQEVIADSLTLKNFPELTSILKEGLKQMKQPAPAYKRGIPVHTKLRFPVILNSEDL